MAASAPRRAISSLADPINSDLSLAWARGFDSVPGGILTLAASALLWPSHRPRELPIELGAAIAANRDYLQRLLEARGSGEVPGMVDASRRLAGLASNNAEASLERLLAEPGANSIITEATMTIVTSVRRITGSITLLSLLPAKTAAPLRERKLGSIVAWIQDSLDEMEGYESKAGAWATSKGRRTGCNLGARRRRRWPRFVGRCFVPSLPANRCSACCACASGVANIGQTKQSPSG
jgi:hypothetical protein